MSDPFQHFFSGPYRWRPMFVIAVLAMAAYLPTLKMGFLWDDHVIIENNPHIRSWSWDTLKHDFVSDNTQGQGDNYYRPFQAFGHRMDYSLWGLNPLGYHLSDVLVHIANCLLLFQLITFLGFSPWTALMTACLFGVNPIGIEQFLVASGRTTPLSFFFSLVSILLLLKPTAPRVTAGLLSFSLALLTKEMSVITPALLLLTLYFKGAAKKQYWVLAPMGVLTIVYLAARQQAVHAVTGPLDPELLKIFIFKVFPRMLWHYASLILVPWNLHSHRLIPRLSHAWPLFLAGWLGFGAWLVWKKNKLGIFCLGWLVLGLLPTIPVMIRGGFMLDHWGYWIAPGVLLPLGLLLAKGWTSPRPRLRLASCTLFFGLIISWSLVAHLNVALRGTDEKIYRWALYSTNSNPVKYNLGIVLLQTGRPQEAIPYFEQVRAYYPEDPKNVNALATAYWQTGHKKTGLRLLEDFAKLYPEDKLTRDHLRHMKTSLIQK